MLSQLRQALATALRPGQDFRPQVITVAALVGIPVSWTSALINLVLVGTLETVLVNFLAGVAILGLYWFARRTGRYDLSFMVASVGLFVVVFPWLFFTSGGSAGGMPVFFMFAIAFSAIILEGVALWVLVPLEMVVFLTCLFVAYRYPQLVVGLSSPLSVTLDTAFSVVATGAAMVISVRMLVGIYDRNRRQLETRNAELARVDQAKTEFLAMVAHELNTPLTVIRAHADESARHLADRGDGDQDVHNLEVIESEAERLGRLVTQLLELARIDEGRTELHLGAYNLDTIVQQTMQAYGPVWAHYGNTLRLPAGGGDAPVAWVDRERVVQIVVNLVSNAVRHTHDGQIMIGVRTVAEFAELSVVDTGVGIAPELLPTLGDRPARGRVGGVRSARDAGLGVGLVITKHLVNAHGGSFRIESVLGEGTAVRCTFPLAELS